MSEAQPNAQQVPPPPPPGYYAPPPYGWYAPQPPPERPFDRLTWKQKIIVGGVVLLLLLILGVWNSCHTQPQPATRTNVQQQPGFLPPNPQTIESQREAAERELQKAQAEAEAAKKRLANAPNLSGHANAPQNTGIAGQQNPDAQFWHQIRQDKWKREQEAPYASGVGFVTRQPHENKTEAVNNRPALEGQMPGYYAPMPVPQQQPQKPVPSTEKHSESHDQIQPGKGPLRWPDSPLASDNPHPIKAGTIIPATLLNQLDGEFTGPVICQISEDVYDDSGTTLRIPAGSKVLGKAHPVSSGNQRRLAVAFYKLAIKGQPDISLDKLPGLDQTGASALAGKVNNHFLQTFGMALAVGGIAGLAQIGNNGAVYSPWYGFREGVSQQTALSSEQILNRYLNRYPTVTIPPGSRVKIILLSDL